MSRFPARELPEILRSQLNEIGFRVSGFGMLEGRFKLTERGRLAITSQTPFVGEPSSFYNESSDKWHVTHCEWVVCA